MAKLAARIHPSLACISGLHMLKLVVTRFALPDGLQFSVVNQEFSEKHVKMCFQLMLSLQQETGASLKVV